MRNNIQYITYVPYANFNLWDAKRYTSKLISSTYKIHKLGDCIQEQNKKYKIFEDKEKEFGILGVNNKTGIFDAYTQKGSEINQPYKKMEVGWLAYNPYRINVGSIGIKLKQHLNSYISPAYVVFSCKENILPEFLFFLFKTNVFNTIINESTTGSVRQNLTFETLKNIEIPIPSISEQYSLIEDYTSKLKYAQLQEQQAKILDIEIKKFLFSELGIDESKNEEIKPGLNLISYSKLSKWALSHLTKSELYNFGNEKYKTEKIKNLLLFFEGGKTPSKARNDYWKDGNVYWTSAKDFNSEYMDSAEDKITSLAVNETGMKVYPKGIFLSVFRSGILQHSFPTVITTIETTINQDLKAYQLNEELIDKHYYLYFVLVFKKYILQRASKKSVTVESINTEDFLEINIPLPPLEKQKEIANHIALLKKQIKEYYTISAKNKDIAIIEFENKIFN